ncbi:arginine repressor [Periweissella beninensis]|uniref:Arginine repressor n=1 Tax=Periweissella beninensis TaxID=504936 RepID=A0ABT0VIV3_9LACO|nr:ArgR family transcriptional regulator [Periweissella beninensis]MBM7544223.1 transcriptional regulator of arginine metabolism [Periweissella beninensis]MCM2437570.1 ArgR family transcriptional regulator [Periweissella beninensis]MCT4396605.1 ArgR family transcriptional regulator [Periweissella beninensis]
MNKQQRLAVLKNILETQNISSQKDIVAAFAKEGIIVKQSSISRDLANLNYVKTTSINGKTQYQKLIVNNNKDVSRLYEMLNEVMISITQVQFMNIIKTLPANGNLLAALIDEAELPSVVGTLAGHDTIYMTSPSEDVAKLVHDEFINYLNTDNLML